VSLELLGDEGDEIIVSDGTGVTSIPVVEIEGSVEMLARCPNGCHALIRLPDGTEVWGEVEADARETWAHLPVVEEPDRSTAKGKGS
jgi:hypothetical protein